MLKKNLEQCEKNELIAFIMTPLPTTSSRKFSLDPEVYRQQVLAAMSAGDYQRKHKRDEVQRRLTAIKTIADEFAAQENYATALTIYEVLIIEVIEHFNDYQDEYVAFSVILTGCIDGLDSCFAGETDNPEMRLRVIQVLFAIYRFYTDSWMDLWVRLHSRSLHFDAICDDGEQVEDRQQNAERQSRSAVPEKRKGKNEGEQVQHRTQCVAPRGLPHHFWRKRVVQQAIAFGGIPVDCGQLPDTLPFMTVYVILGLKVRTLPTT